MYSYTEPVYLISVVAKILNVHPQTLRQYEREGLIKPSRTEGRMRLYSQKDIDEIKMVLTLTRDMGVNLAGVDVILQLKKELENYQKRIKELEEELNRVKNDLSTIPLDRRIVVKKDNYQVVLIDNVEVED